MSDSFGRLAGLKFRSAMAALKVRFKWPHAPAGEHMAQVSGSGAFSDFVVVPHIYPGQGQSAPGGEPLPCPVQIGAGEFPVFLRKEHAHTDPNAPPEVPPARTPAAKCRSHLRADATTTLALLALAGAWVRVADAPMAETPRNPAADAIADRFSHQPAPEASIPVVANLEQRLNFVPRETMLWDGNAAKPAPGGALVNDETPSGGARAGLSGVSLDGPLDSLGVVIFRNLPEGSTFSAGAQFSPTSWAVAEGDLDKLIVSLSGPADRPILAEVEVMSPSGVASGVMHIEIRRAADGAVALAHPGVASTGAIMRVAKLPQAAAPDTAPAPPESRPKKDSLSKSKPGRHRATVKRKGKSQVAHRSARPAPAARRTVVKTAPPPQDAPDPKAGPVADQPGQALFPSPSGPPANVLTGIGKFITDLIPGKPGAGPTPSLAPAGE